MEKAPYALNNIAELEKHLHGRGEGINLLTPGQYVEETPPRTWRRRLGRLGKALGVGNTSTDVEKTHRHDPCFRITWKHLHGRGEDLTNQEAPIPGRETPPRTWRRLAIRQIRRGGNEKHLHGRGEDLETFWLSGCLSETPPRTWRRPPFKVLAKTFLRNTSTDVEKTSSTMNSATSSKKHLHGRGED